MEKEKLLNDLQELIEKYDEPAIREVIEILKSRKTYLEDFREKFPYCVFDDIEICSKFCVNQFYRNGGLEDCNAAGWLEDCMKCWESYVKD